MKFTESVRSFHVPETPGTAACPPSLPSLPTSRATRVTSDANDDSWSTIVLTVLLSSKSSPFTSTTILRDRSPLATAVVTPAMSRTWLVRLLAIEFTESVRSFHVPETPATWACPPSLPSVPTSRATRVTSSANDPRVSVIVLMVSVSSATSPRAVTVIFCVRSPRATARATEEMPRTWSVRLLAMTFTESVRSRHVPLTPLTSAWPPRRPSVPTSRATRVTSSAKDESWSTIRFTVCLSSSTSPCTSTVTLRDRSPLATAVVTTAMSRTCAVSRLAIEFTESVRSFQLPDTPRTFACPPRLPSVPTSRATRVTSELNSESWSTIALTVRPIRRNSPRSGAPTGRSSMRCPRSPSATASITRATSVTGRTRSSTRLLASSKQSAHVPVAPVESSRSCSRPSRPAVRRTRRSSAASLALRSATSLYARASSASTPLPVSGRRLRKFPSRSTPSASSRRFDPASSRPPFDCRAVFTLATIWTSRARVGAALPRSRASLSPCVRPRPASEPGNSDELIATCQRARRRDLRSGGVRRGRRTPLGEGRSGRVGRRRPARRRDAARQRAGHQRGRARRHRCRRHSHPFGGHRRGGGDRPASVPLPAWRARLPSRPSARRGAGCC